MNEWMCTQEEGGRKKERERESEEKTIIHCYSK